MVSGYFIKPLQSVLVLFKRMRYMIMGLESFPMEKHVERNAKKAAKMNPVGLNYAQMSCKSKGLKYRWNI